MTWKEYNVYLQQAKYITNDFNLDYVKATNLNGEIALILSDRFLSCADKIKLILKLTK